MAGVRIKELFKKYGKVALGVHLSVSAASITGLYIAIKSNVDVESIIETWHLSGFSKNPGETQAPQPSDGFISTHENTGLNEEKKQRNRTAELVTSSGGALALALLCNKALFPVRVPITIALTPPVARFLARRKIN